MILILLAVSLGVPALFAVGCYLHSARAAKAYVEWFDSPEYKRLLSARAATNVASSWFHDEALTMLREDNQGAQP